MTKSSRTPDGGSVRPGARPGGFRSDVGGSSFAFDEIGESDGSDSQEDKSEDKSCEHSAVINPGCRISSKIVRGKKTAGSLGGAQVVHEVDDFAAQFKEVSFAGLQPVPGFSIECGGVDAIEGV